MDTTHPPLSNPIQVLNLLLADPLERLIRTSVGDGFAWHLLHDGRTVDPGAADKLRDPQAVEFYGGRLAAAEGDDIQGAGGDVLDYMWNGNPRKNEEQSNLIRIRRCSEV